MKLTRDETRRQKKALAKELWINRPDMHFRVTLDCIEQHDFIFTTMDLDAVPLQAVTRISMPYRVWSELQQSTEWSNLAALIKELSRKHNLPLHAGVIDSVEKLNEVPSRLPWFSFGGEFVNERREGMKDPLYNGLYDAIEKCREELEPSEAQSLVESIIGLMREKNITYDCAYTILNATRSALEQLSRRLSI